jgi:hypothetical protein
MQTDSQLATEDQILERAEQNKKQRLEKAEKAKEKAKEEARQAAQLSFENDKKKREKEDFVETRVMSMLRLIRRIWMKTDDVNMAFDVCRRLRRMLENIEELQLNSHNYVSPLVKYQTKYSKLFEDLQKKQAQVKLYLDEKKWFNYSNYFPEEKDIKKFGESYYAFYKYNLVFSGQLYNKNDSESERESDDDD